MASWGEFWLNGQLVEAAAPGTGETAIVTDLAELGRDLLRMPLAEAMGRAAEIRRAAWGDTVTYSRKVFVPLTNMCRDTCGYCTFVKHPDDPDAAILDPETVLRMARDGEARGCKELLFSLGEKPELRYAQARAALGRLGYARMTDYLADMCALVLAETTLLPHVNAGTLSDDEIVRLRPVAASMGMMLETVSRRLMQPGMAHHACPDKVPVQRLRTLERAGVHRVPFTTGLLIGIGETWAERIETLAAIEAAHRRHGHIQEVIVQNFQRKPGIAMADHPEPSLEDMLRTIAAARIMLSPEISVQAPPNLSERHMDFLGAGINDWGGISPVTIDFINPGHAWPQVETLSRNCAAAGFRLQERLTVYPRYIGGEAAFLDREMRGPVARLARDDGLAESQTIEVPA